MHRSLDGVRAADALLTGRLNPLMTGLNTFHTQRHGKMIVLEEKMYAFIFNIDCILSNFYVGKNQDRIFIELLKVDH